MKLLSQSFGSRCAIAATMLAAAVPSSAQQVPVVQAGAGGRYETQLDPKRTVAGVPAANVAAFRRHIDRLASQFAAMPEVTEPPAPLCNRLGSWIEITRPHGVLAAEVRVMQPILFERGRCHNMTGTGVFAGINRLSLLLDKRRAHVAADESVGPWWAVPVEVAGRRVIDLGDRVAFTHGRAPLLVPVAAERYLKELIRRAPAGPEGGPESELRAWLNGGKAERVAENDRNLRSMAAYLPPDQIARIAQSNRRIIEETEAALRKAAAAPAEPSGKQVAATMLARLGEAERTAPACISMDTGEFDSAAGCPRGFTLVELNPAYFDKSRPDAVQLLVIETPSGRTHGESDAKLAMRRAIWAALDRDALAALVS